MGPSRGPLLPGRSLYRLLLLLAAVDRLGWGLWALLRPEDLFRLLQVPLPEGPPDDQLLLWKLLSVLALAHAAFLVMLVWQPEAWGPAALVPLLGFALGTGLWLWVAGTDRLQLPSRLPPLLLAAHDAVGLPVCAGFLVAWYLRRRRTGSPVTPTSSPGA
jgi:hypothetical protein